VTDYYERRTARHLDGSPIFRTAEDERAEEDAARRLEAAWGCTLQRFGKLSPVDWFAVRDERMVGVLELKSRGHTSDTYPTVFLNVRKWLALLLAAHGLGVPAIFVAQFPDCLTWVPVAEIDARRHRIAGCRRIVKARSDVEPVIDVPVSQLRRIGVGTTRPWNTAESQGETPGISRTDNGGPV
jgi:hypothetical protein